CVCCCQPRDGHAEGRAAYVVQAHTVTEFNALGVAAVFAADADFKVRTRLASLLYADFDERTDAGLIQHLEWILRQEAMLDVVEQEFTFRVVTADAKGGLSQVVGAEGEEF